VEGLARSGSRLHTLALQMMGLGATATH
jgi:hypothetical protein